MVRGRWTQLLLLLSLQQLTPTLALKPEPRSGGPVKPKPESPDYPILSNNYIRPDRGPPYRDIPPPDIGARPHPGPIYVVSWTVPDVAARDGLEAGRVRAPWLHNPEGVDENDPEDPDYHTQRGYSDAISAIRVYTASRTQHTNVPFLYEFSQGQSEGRFHAGSIVRHALLRGLEQPLIHGNNHWSGQNWRVYFRRLHWENANVNVAGPSGQVPGGSSSTQRPPSNPAGQDGDGPQLERPSTSRGRPADQDGDGPQLQRPEVNKDNLGQWSGGNFGAVSCAAIIAALSPTRHNELRSIGDVKDAGRNDCHQAQQMAGSLIQIQRQLQNMDFAALNPAALRLAQPSDFMTPAQCDGVMAGLIKLWESRGQWHPKETKKEGAPRNQCARLAEEVTLVEPSACNLDYIDVDVLLADESWAGTDHMMDLVVHGKFAKSASEPIRLGSDVDRGWRHTQRINLQKEFNAETISIKSINGLQLWSGKDELWVQGAPPLLNL
ncbi:hypothetical protein MAJ_11366, partial [Metarhizium majus ARSEF 297]